MFSRRTLLRLGSGGFLGLGLEECLALGRLPAAPVAAEQSAIFIFLGGGPSHVDSFDPKPSAPEEYRGSFDSIATPVPGVRFSEHLPRLAQRFQKFAVLRAVSHTQGVHEAGRRYLMTGDRVATAQSPALGAVTAFKGRRRASPPYVAIPALEPNAGSLGASCDPYNLLGDGGELLAAGPAFEDAESLGDFARRVELLRDLDQKFTESTAVSASVRVRNEAYRQAFELLTSRELRRAADLASEPQETRDEYGRFAWGDYLLLARRMIEAGSRFVSVAFEGWDTHAAGFTTLATLLPELDQALAALVDDLENRGLLERTSVVALGEFGRTPRVNAGQGRDHWPRAMSVLWAGGGAQGGRIVGATDRTGSEPVDGAVAPEDLAFTLLRRLGIDPDTTYVPPGGRKLLTGGRMIRELF